MEKFPSKCFMNNSFPTYTKVNNVEHICNGYSRKSYIILFFRFEIFETIITQLQFANFFGVCIAKYL